MNTDIYLDPLEELDQKICKYCGKEMVEDEWGDWMKRYMKCTNSYCPEKFDKKCGTTVIDMAKHLVEVEQDLEDYKNKAKVLHERNERLTSLLESRE